MNARPIWTDGVRRTYAGLSNNKSEHRADQAFDFAGQNLGALMDEEIAQKIAGYIAEYLPQRVWPLLLVQLFITLLAAGIGAFLGEYFKTRGKNLATKADFDSLTKQLKANTELVEAIKAEVAQKDWVKREWTNLRRIKLEELLQKMHDCHVYLNTYLSAALEGDKYVDRDPGDELDTIAMLYFPKIEQKASDFLCLHRKQREQLAHLSLKMREASQISLGACKAAFDDYKAKDNREEISQSAKALTKASRELLVDILEVKDE